VTDIDQPEEEVEEPLTDGGLVVEKPKRKHVRTTGLQPTRLRVTKPRKKTNVPPDWRNDLNVLKRLEMLSRFASMGWTGESLYQQVQAWLLSQGQPGTSWQTFGQDQRRLLTLLQEFPQVTAEEVAASIRTTKKEAWRQALNPKATRAVDSLRVVNDSDLILAKLAGILTEKGDVNVQVGVRVASSQTTFDPAKDTATLRAALLVLNDGLPRLTDGGDEIGLEADTTSGSQKRLAPAPARDEDDE
jgi:hypothetical protein